MDISFFTRQSFGSIARFDPRGPALGMEDQPALTYAEVACRSRSYANALLDLGVRPGDRVAILLFNSTEYWLAYFAITRIGAIAARLNFRLGPDELEFALCDSDACVLLADAALLGVLEDRRERLPVRHYVAAGDRDPPSWALPWTRLESAPHAEPPVPLPDADAPAMLMYTSGTTGRPKGALWSHGTTTWWTAMQVMEWGLTADSVTMVTGPLYHIGGLENYALPTLAVGGRVVLLRSRDFDLGRTLQIASRERVTDLLLFPTMISQWLQSPELHDIDLSSVTRIFTGGDPLLPWAVSAMRERFGWMDLVQVYGLTEGTPIAACGAPGAAFEDPAIVGRAFPFTEVAIRDPEGQDLPDGQRGEIWIRSPAVALGYWRRPEATAEVFVDGWCRSGDLGVAEHGGLRITGREKDMIRSGGENIYPAEVEDALLRHPKIADAAVIGVSDPVYIETVCAVVVLRPGERMTEQEVITACAQRLAGFKKPRRVEFVDELPRTASQKVMKYLLRESFGAPTATLASESGRQEAGSA
ncbi:MAG: AMP-dependent synthetase and ligase [Chthonomonadaceae bacterium]|nr:AMP-dependent synthetase and ligase [Chthonomonadaceae bacterium]